MKKNVLHILMSNKLSGAENVVCDIIKNDTDYNMFYCSPKVEITNILSEKNIKYIELKNINKIIKYNKIDVVIAHDFIASCIAAIKIKNIPIISYIHCNPKFVQYWNIFSYVYYKLSKKFKNIVFVSQEAAKSTIFYQELQSKIKVVNNAIDVEKIKEWSKKEKTNNYDILFVGRLIDLKQPLLVIDIIKELNNLDIKCCIVGDGVLYKECKNKIKKYCLEEKIYLVGFKSNPYAYMQNSKILLIPSLEEGFSLTCIEAMALNTVVLNSGNGGLKNIFQNNKELICSTKEEYVDKIKHYLINEKDFLNMQKKCLNISKNYTNIESWIRSINSVLEER